MFASEVNSFFLPPAGLEMRGAASVLRKYCGLLCGHVNNVLSSAVSVVSIGSRYFCPVSQIISKDVTGIKPETTTTTKLMYNNNNNKTNVFRAVILAESFITKISSCGQQHRHSHVHWAGKLDGGREVEEQDENEEVERVQGRKEEKSKSEKERNKERERKEEKYQVIWSSQLRVQFLDCKEAMF